MTEEEQNQINFAIAVSLVIIFMILAALYESFIQPFFIMLAVPLSLIGVFVAFVVAKAPFDPTAYIGVILLSRDRRQQRHPARRPHQPEAEAGMALLEAVVGGTKDRVRPIFMTTATTVFGMLPMLLIRRRDGQAADLVVPGPLHGGRPDDLDAPHPYRHSGDLFHGDKLNAWGAEKAREARGLFRAKKPSDAAPGNDMPEE